MNVDRKDATIVNTDDAGPGSFEVILSSPTLDRDGDTLKPDEWKTPLPGHITFDVDHGMDVASTVGSGVPRIDEETGNLIVSGTYSSLPRAQDVRTLVNEGHIRTTSVAFMTEKTQKDGKAATVRELLNGAFVAVPSNREALVLASKALKAGARNSASDAEHIQSIHDHALALGAVPSKSVKALNEAVDLLAGVDVETLPAEVKQAIALIQSAYAVGEPLDASSVPDPDEDDSADPAAVPAAAPAKAAAPAETTAADAEALTLRVRSLSAFAAGYTS